MHVVEILILTLAGRQLRHVHLVGDRHVRGRVAAPFAVLDRGARTGAAAVGRMVLRRERGSKRDRGKVQAGAPKGALGSEGGLAAVGAVRSKIEEAVPEANVTGKVEANVTGKVEVRRGLSERSVSGFFVCFFVQGSGSSPRSSGARSPHCTAGSPSSAHRTQPEERIAWGRMHGSTKCGRVIKSSIRHQAEHPIGTKPSMAHGARTSGGEVQMHAREMIKPVVDSSVPAARTAAVARCPANPFQSTSLAGSGFCSTWSPWAGRPR